MLDSDLVLLNTQAARRVRRRLACRVAALTLALAVSGGAAASSKAAAPAVPDFGPNVKIFDPSMSTSDIQSAVNAAQSYESSHPGAVPAVEICPGTYSEQVTILKSLGE